MSISDAATHPENDEATVGFRIQQLSPPSLAMGIILSGAVQAELDLCKAEFHDLV
jgi:hypothetical protein